MKIVMGLPGAGKSTVLAAAAEKGIRIINYGDLMFDIASRTVGIKHRDELRKLPPATQKKVQAEAGIALSKMKADFILDTHCSIATKKGYLPGLPCQLLTKLHVDGLILITAPVAEIMERRSSDKTRVRDSESFESLSGHDEMNKALLAAYACITGAPAAIIQNRQGKLEAAQKEFLSLLGQ